MTALGVETLAVPTDVADPEAVDRLRDEALERFGRVHLVCNNAGVAGSMTGLGVDLDDWRWVLGVNLWGVVHGHRSFLPHLLEHGDGHIVNTASMAGHHPGHSAYSASKWAVVSLSEGLYQQLRAQGATVGVSCLCPGWVATDIATSYRNRPEWAAPRALDEEPDDERVASIREFVRDQLKSGMRTGPCGRPGARCRGGRSVLDLHRHGHGHGAGTPLRSHPHRRQPARRGRDPAGLTGGEPRSPVRRRRAASALITGRWQDAAMPAPTTPAAAERDVVR